MLIDGAIDLEEALRPDEMLENESLAESCTYDDRYTDEREVDGVTYLVDYDWYDNCGDTKARMWSAWRSQTPPTS